MDFPILPFIDRRDDGSVRFFKRNPRLFTPKDFDYSPYFDIIKYPFLGLGDLGVYRKLPWSDDSHIYNDEEEEFDLEPDEEEIEEEPVLAAAQASSSRENRLLRFFFGKRGGRK